MMCVLQGCLKHLTQVFFLRQVPAKALDTSPHLTEGTVMMRICEVLKLLGTLVDYSVNEGVTQVGRRQDCASIPLRAAARFV